FLTTTPSPPELYPLSLPDALPILGRSVAEDDPSRSRCASPHGRRGLGRFEGPDPALGTIPTIRFGSRRRRISPKHGAWQTGARLDRKSTRLYSSHDQISYAVFCLK